MKKQSGLIKLYRDFLAEDAPDGDVTTLAVLGVRGQFARARILAKQDLTVSGFFVVKDFLKTCFPKIKINIFHNDGKSVSGGTELARLDGPVSDLLLSERTLLNILQHLSGIATLTSHFVKIVKPHGVKILDTRKTLPGWRDWQKQAVRHGGGYNHRRDLSAAYLIKDNHITAAGSVTTALKNVQAHQKKSGQKKIVEVEVKNILELKEALSLKPHIILLDNMTPAKIRESVKIRNTANKKIQLEISGGVTLKTLPQLAKLGVERISVGALTHSAPAADISMKIGTDF